jgi:hypothetical protein
MFWQLQGAIECFPNRMADNGTFLRFVGRRAGAAPAVDRIVRLHDNGIYPHRLPRADDGHRLSKAARTQSKLLRADAIGVAKAAEF